ncbi:BON domain-containing protein [Aquisalimonas sp. 2447]|uniref:BON domain-containing protein n=1 Tax=Aquisalimonas sp. 2447 TaxID=2740807 RepID=UPI00143265B7|nr:BON domain-containing protein [Aquisalimonas sp. 2447]QIT56291.1 BON domain-containing protein [Aquisalimonas sp. 2447]
MAARARDLAVTLVLGLALGACAGPTGNGDDNAASALESRSLNERLADQRIRSAIMAELLSDEELRHESNISVTVFDGIVLLTGEVPDREAGQRMARLARDESDARHVFNELVIAQLSSVFSRTRDRMLVGRAATRLLPLDDPETLDRARFHIVAERQRLYLMGRVTREEAEAITEEVRRISGVREVVRLFEYLE